MNNCIYCELKIIDGIEHEICKNEEIKSLNHASEKEFPCNGYKCGKYEYINLEGKQ